MTILYQFLITYTKCIHLLNEKYIGSTYLPTTFNTQYSNLCLFPDSTIYKDRNTKDLLEVKKVIREIFSALVYHPFTSPLCTYCNLLVLFYSSFILFLPKDLSGLKARTSILYYLSLLMNQLKLQVKKKKKRLRLRKIHRNQGRVKEKNMESGFTPSIVIWQLWSRDSYLDLVSLIQGQKSRVQLSSYQALRLYFFGKKLNFISKTFHSKGEELISHLHVYQKKLQGLIYFLWKNQGTKPIFPVFVLIIPLVSSAALRKDKLPRTLRDYTEYNHLFKKKTKTILQLISLTLSTPPSPNTNNKDQCVEFSEESN